MIAATPKSSLPSPSSTLTPPSLSVSRGLPRSLRKSASAIGLNSNSPSTNAITYTGPALATIASSSNLHSLYNSSINSNHPSSTAATHASNLQRPVSSHATRQTPGISLAPAAPLSAIAPPALAPPPLTLGRKTSFGNLNQSALHSVPDATKTYPLSAVSADSVVSPPTLSVSRVDSRPGSRAGGLSKDYSQSIMADDMQVGDLAEAPNGLLGTVRFVGTVNGKKGTFVGIELLPEFAGRGKNSGDVDGVSYFTTTLAGAGIFVPQGKVMRRDNGNNPPTPSSNGGLKAPGLGGAPTPGLGKFSQSIGPGRSSSPLGKKSRPSLHRPESPARRLAMTPSSGRPSIGPGTGSPNKGKYGSPTVSKFSQSVRGTSGDPSKKLPGGSRLDFKQSLYAGAPPQRSSSALGMGPMNFDEDEPPVPSLQRAKTNGSAAASGSRGIPNRPASRAQHGHDEEVEKLRAQIDDRDRQLKDQAATLLEMEGALAEVQQLMDNPAAMRGAPRDDLDDQDSSQLRSLVREKNEKIAQLTTEFDSHRADFRSTIDALEMASTETVRVYEAQKKDLVQEINELEARLEDVDAVARQLKQLEELVQELEEGLEDARRGEAEARGEVEFLRGEVERTRSELRREKEKNGSGGAASGPAGGPGADKSSLTLTKELEQKEDEIRGLKAIIHSLSRDSTTTPPISTGPGNNGDSAETRLLREKQERELSELRAMIDQTTDEAVGGDSQRRSGASFTTKGAGSGSRPNSHTVGQRSSGVTVRPSSLRDSTGGRGVGELRAPADPLSHKRASTLDTMPESDTYSTATEASALWCEICETNGHDILTCTNMFGPDGPKPTTTSGNNRDTLKAVVTENLPLTDEEMEPVGDYKVAPLKAKNSMTTPTATSVPTFSPVVPAPPVNVMPNPMESGPVAGKESGVIDASKWCAVCERDGHDSVDCPFEDAF